LGHRNLGGLFSKQAQRSFESLVDREPMLLH
jgi:hypothetical protein